MVEEEHSPGIYKLIKLTVQGQGIIKDEKYLVDQFKIEIEFPESTSKFSKDCPASQMVKEEYFPGI
jgi:hypothetical protein